MPRQIRSASSYSDPRSILIEKYLLNSNVDEFMGQNSVVSFIERWQTGAGILLGSIVGGIFIAILTSTFIAMNAAVYFIAVVFGGLLSFVLISYFLYGH